MGERIRVGVTGNSRKISPSWYCAAMALRLVGANPERISVLHEPRCGDLNALIVGGGDDIGPEHYGQEITAKVKPDPERDELEIKWINKALKRGLPILGICRGAQLVNVVLGGTLHQDIRPLRENTYNRPGILPTKKVALVPESLVSSVSGRTQLRVNSLHSQAIDACGKELVIVGKDLDGIVQAVERPGKPSLIGVQWHPEYLFYLPSQLALFRWLVKEAV